MRDSEDEDQQAELITYRGNHGCCIENRLPGAQLQESITDVEEIVSQQQDVIDGVRALLIAFIELQYKHPSIAVKHAPDPENDIDRKADVNDVCCDVAVHGLLYYPIHTRSVLC